MENRHKSFIVNLGLLVSAPITAFSGLLIQIKYHMGNHGDIAINDRVCGLSYNGWSNVHKVAVVLFSILVIYHVLWHWKWYGMVIRKKLIAKNMQVLTLSVLFVLVALTGFIPWSIDILDGDEILRKIILEIHDKLTLILTVYLALHVIKRVKWFWINYKAIRLK